MAVAQPSPPRSWSLPISPVAGHRMIEYFGANLPSGADIIQALQPKPDRLGARLPVPLASKKTAQARHHPNGVPEAGGLGGATGSLRMKPTRAFHSSSSK